MRDVLDFIAYMGGLIFGIAFIFAAASLLFIVFAADQHKKNFGGLDEDWDFYDDNA